jgi:hypothetical protein
MKGTKLNVMGVGVDFAVNYVEVPLNLAYKLIIGLNYGLGLANMSNDPDETVKNGVLSVSAGLWF